MELRSDGANESLTGATRCTANSKAMYDHELTSSEIRAKVGQHIRNGNELNCVGEDQDDFGSRTEKIAQKLIKIAQKLI